MALIATASAFPLYSFVQPYVGYTPYSAHSSGSSGCGVATLTTLPAFSSTGQYVGKSSADTTTTPACASGTASAGESSGLTLMSFLYSGPTGAYKVWFNWTVTADLAAHVTCTGTTSTFGASALATMVLNGTVELAAFPHTTVGNSYTSPTLAPTTCGGGGTVSYSKLPISVVLTYTFSTGSTYNLDARATTDLSGDVPGPVTPTTAVVSATSSENLNGGVFLSSIEIE